MTDDKYPKIGTPFDDYDANGRQAVTTGETANEAAPDFAPQGWRLEIDDGPSPEERIAELQRNLAQANDAMLAAMQSKAELEERYTAIERSSYEKNVIIASLEAQLTAEIITSIWWRSFAIKCNLQRRTWRLGLLRVKALVSALWAARMSETARDVSRSIVAKVDDMEEHHS